MARHGLTWYSCGLVRLKLPHIPATIEFANTSPPVSKSRDLQSFVFFVNEMADQQQSLQAPAGGNSGSEEQPPNSDQPSGDVWDEEKLEKAMKTLKEMHIQARRSPLRFSDESANRFCSFEVYVPQSPDSSLLWLPSNPHVCPGFMFFQQLSQRYPRLWLTMLIAEALFREFSKAAVTANEEIQEFRKLMNDQESIQVFEQAKKSRAERPSGIKAWKVTDHPDWLTRDT
jgi:hypothetical protein